MLSQSISDNFSKIEDLQDRLARQATFKKLDMIIQQQKQIHKKLDFLWNKRRAIKSTPSELCGALYDTIRHTCVSAIEQFYEVKFSSLCDEIFADQREISESVQFCASRLEEIRELISLIFVFEPYAEPALPCTEKFAEGFRSGFRAAIKQLKEFIREKLINIGEVESGTAASHQQEITDLHREIPLLGAWMK